MGTFVELVKAVIRSYGQLLLDPVMGFLFLIVLMIVGDQYRRIEANEKKIFGQAFNKALPQTVKAMAFGLLGGLLSSILLVLIGVSLTDSGIQYLLPVAVGLYLINPRFLCFSYAGGILSVLHLLTGWPRVNVPVVTGLVACLHAVESLLIRLSGSTCASPVVLQRKEGDVVGGFVLQRFWPVPLILLALTVVPETSALPGDVICLPDWWPLLRGPIPQGPGVPIFVMTPIMAGLGYSDLALTTSPEKRSRETSRTLAIYSVVLLALSILSAQETWVQWVAALFAPLGHELVIWTGIRKEREGKPYYVSAEGVGATILEVIPGSEASRVGLKRGNIITSISGMAVTRETLSSLREMNDVTLEVVRSPGDPQRTTVHLSRQGNAPFGFFTAPMPGDQPLMELGRESPLMRFIKRLLRKRT